jgi:hypothetical protein
VRCETTVVVGGEIVTAPRDTPFSITIGTDAMSSDWRAGHSVTNDLGVFTITTQVTAVRESSNGVTVENTLRIAWSCKDTCRYAGDFACDEVTYCDLGTDCSDCDQLILVGSGTTSFKKVGEMIEMSGSGRGADSQGFVTLAQQCSGTLSR